MSNSNPSNFVFVTCQAGAEAAARKEIPNHHPELKLAFSRPGFVTFKIEEGKQLAEKFALKSTLARTAGWSLGRAESESASEIVAKILEDETLAKADVIHVWERDRKVPGTGGFEPGVSVLASEAGEQIVAAMKSDDRFKKVPALNVAAKPDQLVFDVCLVEPNQWWFGFHVVSTVAGRWCGGVPAIDTESEPISRAYFKLKEAIMWAGFPIAEGDICAEIGSAPGGASQLLLEMGAQVIGIDPAEMDFEHDNLVHIQRRGHEVKKRDFRNVQWLFADINMVPTYTLDTVSEIVAHSSVDIKGLALTLKLTNWEMLEKVPEWIARIKGLGFKLVKTRQLAFNRQEICLIAAKDRFLLRAGKQKLESVKKAPASS
jgi:23S rRNA (cytidine2498-2'-O)-methyltransferase